uniref:ULP_PROTEASE domain-containing protein n=1 Tax=Parastrongyloides trichosuri TaxID=131310 RepID=A0A0N4ZXE0_PARTI
MANSLHNKNCGIKPNPLLCAIPGLKPRKCYFLTDDVLQIHRTHQELSIQQCKAVVAFKHKLISKVPTCHNSPFPITDKEICEFKKMFYDLMARYADENLYLAYIDNCICQRGNSDCSAFHTVSELFVIYLLSNHIEDTAECGCAVGPSNAQCWNFTSFTDAQKAFVFYWLRVKNVKIPPSLLKQEKDMCYSKKLIQSVKKKIGYMFQRQYLLEELLMENMNGYHKENIWLKEDVQDHIKRIMALENKSNLIDNEKTIHSQDKGSGGNWNNEIKV